MGVVQRGFTLTLRAFQMESHRPRMCVHLLGREMGSGRISRQTHRQGLSGSIGSVGSYKRTKGRCVDVWGTCMDTHVSFHLDVLLRTRPPLFHQQLNVAFFLPFLKSRFNSRLREKLPALYPQIITFIREGMC